MKINPVKVYAIASLFIPLIASACSSDDQPGTPTGGQGGATSSTSAGTAGGPGAGGSAGSATGGGAGAGTDGGDTEGGTSSGAINCSAFSVKISGALTLDYTLPKPGPCVMGNVLGGGIVLNFIVDQLGADPITLSFLGGVMAGTPGMLTPNALEVRSGAEIFSDISMGCKVNLTTYDKPTPTTFKMVGSVSCSGPLTSSAQPDGGVGAKIETWSFSIDGPITNSP
jgi:hypothetical protein